MVDLYISQCTVEYFREEWSIGGDMGQLEISSIVPFFFQVIPQMISSLLFCQSLKCVILNSE